MAIITGTTGRDSLSGNGNDTFTGGVGNDTFKFSFSGPAHTDVITDFGSTYFAATITGAQEVPATGSAATGTATAVLRRGGSFEFSAAITGLDLGGQTASTVDNVTASHFHAGPVGVSAGVVFGYIGTPNNETTFDTVVNAAAGTVSGKWDAGEGNGTTLAAQTLNILTNRLYINFHTAPFPAGEIRGQMIAQDQGYDRIDLRGSGITSWAALQPFLSESGGSTRITSTVNGSTYQLVLQNVGRVGLTSTDFIFDGRGAGGFTTNLLVTEYMNQHGGMGPNDTDLGILQNLASTSPRLTEADVHATVIALADKDTAVAVTNYAFFTGTTPSQQGLAYLVSSTLNTNDLNDPYYAKFDLQNRSINFAENLAINGDGAARFNTAYGALTFSQAVDTAYAEIVGNAVATAAGVNVTAALADIKARLPAFQQIAASSLPTANQDLAVKAAAIGYIIAEALRSDIGVYSNASNNFLLDLADGGAAFGVNLVGTYGTSANGGFG